jgi:hypothetical protein
VQRVVVAAAVLAGLGGAHAPRSIGRATGDNRLEYAAGDPRRY